MIMSGLREGKSGLFGATCKVKEEDLPDAAVPVRIKKAWFYCDSSSAFIWGGSGKKCSSECAKFDF